MTLLVYNFKHVHYKAKQCKALGLSTLYNTKSIQMHHNTGTCTIQDIWNKYMGEEWNMCNVQSSI